MLAPTESELLVLTGRLRVAHDAAVRETELKLQTLTLTLTLTPNPHPNS